MDVFTEAEEKQLSRTLGYWGERAAETQAAITQQSVMATEEQLLKYYSASQKKIIGQFEKTYNKILSRLEEGKQPTPADLYKLDTYWQMQADLTRELQKLGDKQAALLSKRFMEQYRNIYDALAVPSQASFKMISKETAEQMINQIWCADGKSWSSRIWTNTNRLRETLNDGLMECLLTGRSTKELKDVLQERFAVSYRSADTLVKTEMAHIQTQAAQQRYKDYGIQQVQIWADYDERRCDICGKLHKTIYPTGASVPIPAHPRCRCCIIPVVE